MIPSDLEYFFILALLSATTMALLGQEVASLVRDKKFWLSHGIFLLICTAIDYVAITNGWWIFPEGRHCGLYLGPIPIEEYILFSVFFFFTAAGWEALSREMD